jgi:hypothetical protein
MNLWDKFIRNAPGIIVVLAIIAMVVIVTGSVFLLH